MKKFIFENADQFNTVLAEMIANGWKKSRDFSVNANVITVYRIDMRESVYFEAHGEKAYEIQRIETAGGKTIQH